MTDRLKNMDAEDLTKIIEYVVKHDTGNKTVSDVKKQLGLTNEEYYEVYTLAMPAIRGMNEGKFWRMAYQKLEAGLIRAVNGKLAVDDKIREIKNIIKHKSLRTLEKERMEGWGAA